MRCYLEYRFIKCQRLTLILINGAVLPEFYQSEDINSFVMMPSRAFNSAVVIKLYGLFVLLLLPSFGRAQAPVSFVLKGQLDPRLNAPAKVYVYQNGEATDSADVRHGAFELRGKAAEPQRSLLTLSRKGNRKELTDRKAGFYLETGTLLFTSPDSLKYARVSGARYTDEWTELWASKKPVIHQISALWKEYDAASPEKRKSATFTQYRQARTQAIARERNRTEAAFIKAHRTSWVSLDELTSMSDDKEAYALVDSLLLTLSPALRNSARAREIQTKMHIVEPVLAVGMQAPDFTLPTPAGKPVTLSQYRGKYVLLDFWASWCGPCRAENPNLIQTYEKLKNKKFDVLSVSINSEDERAKWLQAIKDDKLPWKQVIDLGKERNQAAALYHVKAIPQNFLVDPTGKIIALNLRGDSLGFTLNQLIK